MAFSIPVRVSNAADFKTDEWVKVYGVVERQEIRGRQTTVVVVDPQARPGNSEDEAGDGIKLLTEEEHRYEYIR